MPINEFAAHPAFGITVTVGMYALALAARSRWPPAHPLVLCSGGLMLLLFALDIPYEHYSNGGAWITFWLGPATVALAVPIYKNLDRLKRQWLPVLGGITIGAAGSLFVNGLIAYLLGGSRDILLSMLPKSATTPISIELVRLLGGIPELGAVFTVLTGLFGSAFGTWFLARGGVKDDLSVGIAMGTAAHGIGTAKVIRDSEMQGVYSGLAMGIGGILIALLTIPVYFWLH